MSPVELGAGEAAETAESGGSTEPADAAPDIAPELAQVFAEARRRNFLGPQPLAVQVAHARGFAVAMGRPEAGARLADLGSGGGMPSLVLAIDEWPDITWVLIEAMAKRAEFLIEAVATLGAADRIEVRHQRTEDAGRDPALRATCAGVTARGFGRPQLVAEAAAPLLALRGRLVVSEPPDSDGARWVPAGIAQVGLERSNLVVAATRYQVLVQRELCPTGYPRRPKRQQRHPLW